MTVTYDGVLHTGFMVIKLVQKQKGTSWVRRFLLYPVNQTQLLVPSFRPPGKFLVFTVSKKLSSPVDTRELSF